MATPAGGPAEAAQSRAASSSAESSLVRNDIKAGEGKASFGDGDALIAQHGFDLLLRACAKRPGDDLAQHHVLAEFAEIQASAHVGFFEWKVDAKLLLVVPVAVLCVEECVDGGLVRTAKWRSPFLVIDRFYHLGVNVKPERYAAMTVSVVAPQDGVVPSLAKAEDAMGKCHLLFPCAKASAESRIGLCDSPKLKWIIEVVERGYL